MPISGGPFPVLKATLGQTSHIPKPVFGTVHPYLQFKKYELLLNDLFSYSDALFTIKIDLFSVWLQPVSYNH